MKNTQFTPLSEKEMMNVNGGGLLDNIPVVGGLLTSLLNTVAGLVSSLLGGLKLPI